MIDSDFLSEASRIVGAAEERGIILRLMGASAVRLHCPKFAQIHGKMRRLTDLDFATYGKWNDQIAKLFEEFHYHTRPMLQIVLRGRSIFLNETTGAHADIFTDRLSMSHTIEFRNRLEVDRPTIPLIELLLEKLQIVRITEKDIMDIVILLAEHGLGPDDNDRINSPYFTQLLCDDWPLYYTATTNLEKTRIMLKNYASLLEDQGSVRTVEERIADLIDAASKKPKTLRWKMRARVGTRRKWYNDVDEARE